MAGARESTRRRRVLHVVSTAVTPRSDARRFLEAVTRHHPDPFRLTTRDAFEREVERADAQAASRPDAVCALMRLGALLADRNGHSGVFALDRHRDPLRFYPLRLFEFEDGVFVVSAGDAGLRGAEVLAVGGVPIASLAAEVEPLIPRDNDSTVRARRPGYLVAVEVLEGLGVGGGPFLLRPPRGDPVEVALEPIPGPEYAASVGSSAPLPPASVEWLDEEIILVAYNVTRGETSSLAERIATLARARLPRALILDLRQNGGGDNTTFGPLLRELERQARAARLLVLTSRLTFSAAMQLVVELEQKTDAIFVGEPTGGSPNQFGDAITVELPATGLLGHVATIGWETAGPEDERLTREPDVGVPVRSEDFFCGRDPVLEAAVRAADS